MSAKRTTGVPKTKPYDRPVTSSPAVITMPPVDSGTKVVRKTNPGNSPLTVKHKGV